MKIKFIPTAQAPDKYEFLSGEVIRAYQGDDSEDWDLSGIEEGDVFEPVAPDQPVIDPQILSLDGKHIIRDAFRDSSGELHITLCQPSGGEGVWEESDEIDAGNYDPETQYIDQS